MKNYRAYRINADGSVFYLVTFRADSDSLACERAREITADDKWPGLELWEGERHVHCDGVARLTTGEPDYWRTDTARVLSFDTDGRCVPIRRSKL